MHMDEKNKIIIQNLIEDKKSLWTVVIVLTGGIMGLLASLDGNISSLQMWFRISAAIIGAIFWYFMIMNLISVNNQIKEKIRGIK